MAGFVFRENRVPHYQRLFQKHDGIRQWSKTPKSRVLIVPFQFLMWGGLAASMYGMGRLVLGHKTFFGSK